ncbi:hypothetical protein LTR70_002213 [Exophiala xenobiotica]|uniref:Secondary metabolism biosynthetic enzyme n=1 Tax=Lithohypha guttulata TaxID=1690604 RepID=A0ABR0K062_9EURO|nr:putative secondary metabolism biosynthetic enzyme [Lithohypha guttulata]KAK5096985.1 putative secondary metabolism biosynthetic enzyme [Lithohypha guttulata]KAK5326213.1 hypothetical protein LTR70_002213 [Exophiala xenobiotica]
MDTILHLQGNVNSDLTPLWLVHPISGLALPYLALGELSRDCERPVYGINSPIYAKSSWRIPETLDDLALEYVRLLREHVQPQGPYLLGGWSMGGMIAMRMAAVLEAQDERVIHVILIDAMNPEKVLPFQTSQEHNDMVNLTYNRLVKGVKTPTRPSLRTFQSDSSCDSDIAPPFRPQLNNYDSFSSVSDGSSIDSLSSSSSRWSSQTDLRRLAKAQQERVSDDLPDENYFDDSVNSTEECTPFEMFERMYQHISDGLSMISENHSGARLSSVSAPVTLFKCAVLEKMPNTVSLYRRQAVQRTFDDPKCGWDLPRLKLMLLHCAHDRMFDPEHVPGLSGALRGLLEYCG